MSKTYITNMTVPDSTNTPQTYYFQLDNSIWEARDSSINRRIAEAVTSAIQYFGTAKVSGTPEADFTFISNPTAFAPSDPYQKQKEGKGDFYRWVGNSVEPSSGYQWADGTQTTLSEGDLLVVADSSINGYARYFVLNTEEEWQQNTRTQDGYVPAPTSQNSQKFWATNSSGDPAWRSASTDFSGTEGSVSVSGTPAGSVTVGVTQAVSPFEIAFSGLQSTGSVATLSTTQPSSGTYSSFALVGSITGGSQASLVASGQTSQITSFKGVDNFTTGSVSNLQKRTGQSTYEDLSSFDIVNTLKDHGSSSLIASFNQVSNVTAGSAASLTTQYNSNNQNLAFSFSPNTPTSVSTAVVDVASAEYNFNKGSASSLSVKEINWTQNTLQTANTTTLYFNGGKTATAIPYKFTASFAGTPGTYSGNFTPSGTVTVVPSDS